MKILAVDDEFSVLRHIRNHLQKYKWQVEIANSYDEAKEKILSQGFDVIICDYFFAHDRQRQGLDLISEIRSAGVMTPVIFLTGRKIDEITPWTALDRGVDDFMTKPWRPEELAARIKAVVRRGFACEQNATNLVKHGNIALDLNLKRVLVEEKEIPVGNILFLLLRKLLQNPRHILHYDDLIGYIWGNSPADEERKNTLRVHMTHLKKALGKKYAHSIRTIHGEGYVWEDTENAKV